MNMPRHIYIPFDVFGLFFLKQNNSKFCVFRFMKSVVTLRAHCKGTQHIRKAPQKKEWRRENSKKEPKEELKTEYFKTLFGGCRADEEPHADCRT